MGLHELGGSSRGSDIFGATRFDPRSDRWLRITMYKGAPFPDELGALDPDDLFYPQLADGAAPQ